MRDSGGGWGVGGGGVPSMAMIRSISMTFLLPSVGRRVSLIPRAKANTTVWPTEWMEEGEGRGEEGAREGKRGRKGGKGRGEM